MIQYKIPQWRPDWQDLKKWDRYHSSRELAIQAAREFMDSFLFEDLDDYFPAEIVIKTEDGREVAFIVDVELKPTFIARLKI